MADTTKDMIVHLYTVLVSTVFSFCPLASGCVLLEHMQRKKTELVEGLGKKTCGE